VTVLEELMTIRNLPGPTERLDQEGSDPVLPTRYPLGEISAQVMTAIGIAVNDLWELKTGRRQDLGIRVEHAAAILRSYMYLSLAGDDTQSVASRPGGARSISNPLPTKDGRYFLPHMGLPHLAQRVLSVLDCKLDAAAVTEAVASWDALDLENAIAGANACGAMVRSAAEWAEHPHGRALVQKPVIEITRIGESDPQPLPAGDRPLSGIRALDLTRILAGPTCARTLAEHGADVLMVTAEHLPQSERFVMDTSHGKRTSFLDFNIAEQRNRLLELIGEADVFSQGYRPGVMDRHGLSPAELAELRPGIIYTSMNCYGYDGPFRNRAGWEQLAQTVTGIADENGGDRPQLLPAAACDYTTGYLAAYGTLLALGLRARVGGSYHVRASLCQSGMLIQRQHRVDYTDQPEIDPASVANVIISSETGYGTMKHLGPVLSMSETAPHWALAAARLGSHEPEWLA
jgi:crotonobetainyl-CoA:carnitine CoA-transferase CaiB-like acyl-CoA transferase